MLPHVQKQYPVPGNRESVPLTIVTNPVSVDISRRQSCGVRVRVHLVGVFLQGGCRLVLFVACKQLRAIGGDCSTQHTVYCIRGEFCVPMLFNFGTTICWRVSLTRYCFSVFLFLVVMKIAPRLEHT